MSRVLAASNNSILLISRHKILCLNFATDIQNRTACCEIRLDVLSSAIMRSSKVVIITIRQLINAIFKTYKANKEIWSEFSGIFWYVTMTYTINDKNTTMAKLAFSPEAGGSKM